MIRYATVLAFCAVTGTAEAQSFLNINPSWSPDGRRLVFESRRHGRAQLYLINADGTAERRLTNSAGEDTHPSWSPDGSQIVFDSYRDSVWTLYVIRPDGTGERRLIQAPAAARGQFARHPAWSPDGRRVAFDSDRDGDEEVYVANADGSGSARVTRSPGRDGHPAWSGNDQLIVGSGRTGGGDLYFMRVDGTGARVLGSFPGQEGGAAVSPDGSRVVFFSMRGNSAALFTVNASGGNLQQLTPEGITSYESEWSPDGRQIAYYSDRTGAFELEVMNADGSGKRQLTGLPQPLDPARLEAINVRVDSATYRDRAAVRLTERESPVDSVAGSGHALALVKGIELSEGTIEIDLAGAPRAGADTALRGFVGVVFHAGPNARQFRAFYLRPTNGRSTDQLRRNHATQYISTPDYPWQRLRREQPGVYESYVDLVPGAWTRVKIEISGTRAMLYVHGSDQPALVITDLKPGPSSGGIGLWIGLGTVAHFANLRVTPR